MRYTLVRFPEEATRCTVGSSLCSYCSRPLRSPPRRPKNTAAHRKLVEIFQRAENVYFEQWNAQRIQAQHKTPPPGELHLTPLFGATPGPATYLMEPYLDSEGRGAYKEGLASILKEIFEIEGEFEDNGRMERIKRSIEEALVDINNISMARGEKQVWDDSRVGRRF